ncbi:TPA: DUF4767 domain-containing protein [Enterococcus faecalis]|nr:DUF4767 domain-containing protein [Enterococcus faecalis]
MKKTVLALVLLSILAGCSLNKKESSIDSKTNQPISSSTIQSSSISQSEQVETIKTEQQSDVAQSSSSISSENDAQHWNQFKKEQLQKFMADWGQQINQKYIEYTPENPINFSGVQVPNGLMGAASMQPAIDHQPIHLEWFENGQTTNDYTLVAVYSDAESQPEAQKHLYLFTIVNDKPLVLVTMQNQGNSYGYLSFEATDNTELSNGFAKIVGASAVTKEQTGNISVHPWSSMDEAIDVYEGMYKNTANEISTHISWKNYQRENWSEVATKGDTITMHFTNVSGSGGSYAQLTKVGANTIVVLFDGNASYPDNPSKVLLVQNSDDKVLKNFK